MAGVCEQVKEYPLCANYPCTEGNCVLYFVIRETGAGRLTLHQEGRNPPVLRKEGDTMITYSDLIQFCILLVTLVGLCSKIFKDKK